jgi:uncharacterized protein YndB with AHSA1/START domain
MEWTGARYADTPTVEASTWIDASPERIWPLVSDVALMPNMSGELQAVELLDGAREPGLGVRFRGHNRHRAMGEWSTTCEVVEFEPGRVFGWAVGDPAQPAASWCFRLTGEDGGTKLSQWMRIGPGPSGLTPAIERMPDKEQKIMFVRMRELHTSIANTLADIKKRAES